MMNSPKGAEYISSIEDASILHKFAGVFLITSLVPYLVFSYFLFLFLGDRSQEIAEWQLWSVYLLTALGVLIGFFTLHNMFKMVVDLSNANRRALERILSPSKIQEIAQEKNEIAVLARSFAAITTRLEDNVKSLELAKRTLHSIMSRVGDGISNMSSIDTFLDLIVETVNGALNGKLSMLFIYDGDQRTLDLKSVYGEQTEAIINIKIKVDRNSTLYQILDKKHPAVIEGIGDSFIELQPFKMYFRPPVLCAPLVYRDKLKGAMFVCLAPGENAMDQDSLNLINNLALQTAVAIENARLNRDNERTYFETISALALAVDAKDKYSRGHLDRVANYCVMIGRRLGLDESDIKILRDAARLHDIGKIGIPDAVLRKEGKLTDQERFLMQKHTEIGESIVKPIHSLSNLCDIIRHHHEKLDGTGYPDGLRGEQITPLVRITTIADIYDAITTDRPYRDCMSPYKAREELRSMKTAIDQEILEVFFEALDSQK